MTDKYAPLTREELISKQADEIERLRAALERIGSMEAMTISFAPNKNTNEWRELEARMDYAREALK